MYEDYGQSILDGYRDQESYFLNNPYAQKNKKEQSFEEFLAKKVGQKAAKESLFGSSGATVAAPEASGGMLVGAPNPAVPYGTLIDPASGLEVASAGTPVTNTPATSVVSPYLGLVGAGLGAKGVYESVKDPMGKTNAAKSGAISGAGMGAGLAAASPLLLGAGPIGWGALALGALGGAAFGGGLGGIMGDKSTKQKEEERWAGVGKKDSAFDNFLEKKYPGLKEKDLTWEHIKVNPDNYNNIADWDSWSQQDQDMFGRRMMRKDKQDDSTVDWRQGGIYYNDKTAQAEAAKIQKRQENKLVREQKNTLSPDDFEDFLTNRNYLKQKEKELEEYL